jgi:hypothetical protein
MNSKRPKFPPMRGVPPTIEQRAIADLMLDHSYQRNADARLIEDIASTWDWRLCAPLTVSRRGSPPVFFVIDGQHRLEAARLRGDIPYLPCIISSFETVEEEAGLFVAVNRKRKAPTALETFKAELVAGDEKALQIHRLITEAGLIVAPHGNHIAWKPLMISSIQGVRNAITRHGEKVALDALTDVARAFPTEVLQYGGRILAGLYLLRAKPPEGFSGDAFRTFLGGVSHVSWNAAMLRRQAKEGEAADTAMQNAIGSAWLRWKRGLPEFSPSATPLPAEPINPPPPGIAPPKAIATKPSFTEQLARVASGVPIANNEPIRRPDPYTGGSSAGDII